MHNNRCWHVSAFGGRQRIFHSCQLLLCRLHSCGGGEKSRARFKVLSTAPWPDQKCFNKDGHSHQESLFQAWRFSFCRRFFSPGPQRWQNWQDLLLSQPLVWRNAQGLQFPTACVAEPMLGRDSSLPEAGGGGGGSSRSRATTGGANNSVCAQDWAESVTLKRGGTT